MAENKSKEERQSQILDAALKVFVNKGYADTRMDDIVSKSGLSKGAIYHHYSSKKEMFLSLIDHWEEHTFPDFYSQNGKGRSATEIFRGFVQEILSAYNDRKYVFLAELEFWALANHDDDIRQRVQVLYKKILKLFKSTFNKGVREGEFKRLNPDIAALSIMTVLQGVIWFSIFEYKDLTAEDYLNAVFDFMIFGISNK